MEGDFNQRNKNENAEYLLNKVSQYLGQDPDKLKDAVMKGNISQSLNNLSGQDAEKIKKILDNKNITSKLLSSPKAQKILKDIIGDKYNG